MVDAYQDAAAVAKAQADLLECCTNDEEYFLLAAGISIVSTSFLSPYLFCFIVRVMILFATTK